MAIQRIDKIISGLGLLSRTECKKAAKAGLITVNGSPVKSSDEKADPDTDEIFLNGQKLDTRRFVYYMLNKPAGCVTAREDRYFPTVFDYIDDKRPDLSPVGRLDRDTTGILIITNDGDLNHRLLSPRFHVPKTYIVTCSETPTDGDAALLERGIDIGDEKPTLPAKYRLVRSGSPAEAELIITEGRFHQVKRMFEAIGKPVIKLHRSAFGPLSAEPGLRPGGCRPLTSSEVALLMKAAGRSDTPQPGGLCASEGISPRFFAESNSRPGGHRRY